ncbi:MAG: hypothetical protein ABJB03_00770 [Rhodoglobus sp.]
MRLPSRLVAMTIAVAAFSAFASAGAASAAPASAPAAVHDETVCVSQPNAATLPWQTYGTKTNPLTSLPTTLSGVAGSIASELSGVGPTTTVVEWNAIKASIDAQEAAASTTVSGYVSNLSTDLSSLAAALQVADPANQATWTATINGFNTALTTGGTLAAYTAANGAWGTAVDAYITSVNTAITNVTPIPAYSTVAANIASLSLAMTNASTALQAAVQADLYDTALTQVVLEQVCTAQLAATGTDSLIIGSGIAALALAAGALLLTVRRENAAK